MSSQETRGDDQLPAAATGAATPPEGSGHGVSRRGFLQAIGLSATAAAIPGADVLEGAHHEGAHDGPAGPGAVPVTLTVNGKTLKMQLEPRITLLDALRDHINVETSEHADLTGSKRVCDRASCGACTILLDGKTVYACSVLAITAQGAEIRTIEGLTPAGELSEVQQQFIECDGLMCGFCTPGFVVSATALLEKNPSPTQDEIRRALDGNICRCGTQSRALEAVEKAAGQAQGGR